MKKLILPLVIFVAIVAGGSGIYIGQRSKTIENQTPEPSSQAENPEEPVLSQSSFTITELGLKVTIPETIKDLAYVIKTNGQDNQQYQTAYFSTKTLADKHPDCAADQGSPLGAVSKVPGQYPTEATMDNTAGMLLRQYPDFYVAYSAPQAACADDEGSRALQTSQKDIFRDALSTLDISP